MASRTPPDLPDELQDALIMDGRHAYDTGDMANYSAERIWLSYSTTYPFKQFYPEGRPLDPETRHFHELLHAIIRPKEHVLGAPAIAPHLRKAQAAYVCCFGRSAMFREQLRAFRFQSFRDVLIDTRRRLMAELVPDRAALRAHRQRVSRLRECWAAPLDVKGETTLDIVMQLTPDDWHEIALHWNWDQGVEVLNWITSQPTCDRATAMIILTRANLAQVAEQSAAGPPTENEWRFCWNLAQRVRAGAFTKTGLAFGVSPGEVKGMKATLAQARATGREPWLLPDSLLDEGTRKHKPRYTYRDGRTPAIGWQYDYWLDHVAPPKR
jgi:hypothetical protein